MKAEVNASRDMIRGDAVLDLVGSVKKVVVASGKKILEFDPAGDKEEMLEKICGRTGNLRAPTTKVGNTLYVGFNEELYREKIR